MSHLDFHHSSNEVIFQPPEHFAKQARYNKEIFSQLELSAEQNPELFWNEQAGKLVWFENWQQIRKTSFQSPIEVRWFVGGKLNACYNCIDRHIKEGRGNHTALIWEPDRPDKEFLKITYKELLDKVCNMAFALKRIGVKRGDFVTIYMPMIPEAIYAMLACARIGAPHNVVFGGFAAESMADRIHDCESKFIITADEGIRGGKVIPLKKNVDLAASKGSTVEKILVIKNTGGSINFVEGRDQWFHELIEGNKNHFIECESMASEDPLFILYTSGSTNKPKGVLHGTGGYLTYVKYTYEMIFDYRPGDIYWCTADVGWITGHSYLVYGPLAAGATTLVFEGIPTYPDFSRFWQVIDRHQVNIFYTAPTALRSLMREGEEPVHKYSLQSLRLLGSVGEPINPEAWMWYHKVVGKGRCPIVDTWWQTETGGILISPIPGVTPMKPGSGTKPLPGIKLKLLNSEGLEIEGEGEGVLVIADSWPGQMQTVYKNHSRFEETYFKDFPGYYFSGDGCRRDKDGYLWITGRVDDVIKISGHRIGSAEIESALVSHQSVAEAAVVGFPHPVKGQSIYAFVTLRAGIDETPELRASLLQTVREEIGALAVPEVIQWANKGLPKTRSGKIMRRILRKIIEGHPEAMGDTSTLADPTVVEDLIEGNRILAKN